MDGLVLLADRGSKAWDFAIKIQRYILEKGEEAILYNVPLSHFRNKEIQFESTENLRKKDVYFIQDSSKNPQEWWIELLLLKDMVLSSSASSLTFVLPNLLYSRQDRKDKSRMPISARALAESLSPGLKRIITMDLHSEQIQGFYPSTTPLDNLRSFPEVVKYLTKIYEEEFKNLLIVSPDAGGVPRAKAFLGKIEKFTGNPSEIAFMIKERSKRGEVGEMRYIGPDPFGKNILIVDDIFDSGNTMCKSSKLLKGKGARKIFGYATHGLFTEGKEKLRENFDSFFTSNTHYQEDNFVKIIDVSPVFAEAISRIQKGDSISELFRIS